MTRRIRALTVIQPWASLLAHGIKPVENRTWPPHGMQAGDYLAIHAGAKVDIDEWEGAMGMADDARVWMRELTAIDESRNESSKALRKLAASLLPYSAIVGVAVLNEVRREPRGNGAFWCGPYGWYVRDAVAIEPVPCRGAQGLWTMPDDVLATVRERWAAAR